MRALYIPSRLRMAAFLLLLTVPLAVGEVIVVTRSPWWGLPYRRMEAWGLASFVVIFPISLWISFGRKWALNLLVLIAGLWCCVTAWGAVRWGSPSLGFYSALLLGYWGIAIAWLRHEYSRSFFEPHMKWYQGRPAAVPGLVCLLQGGDGPVHLKVSRIDDQGAFVFAGGATGIFRLRRRAQAEMIFSYRDQAIKCRGIPIRSLEERSGSAVAIGFQFRGMSPDARKELGDFVETLRGEGHV